MSRLPLAAKNFDFQHVKECLLWKERERYFLPLTAGVVYHVPRQDVIRIERGARGAVHALVARHGHSTNKKTKRNLKRAVLNPVGAG